MELAPLGGVHTLVGELDRAVWPRRCPARLPVSQGRRACAAGVKLISFHTNGVSAGMIIPAPWRDRVDFNIRNAGKSQSTATVRKLSKNNHVLEVVLAAAQNQVTVLLEESGERRPLREGTARPTHACAARLERLARRTILERCDGGEERAVWTMVREAGAARSRRARRAALCVAADAHRLHRCTGYLLRVL
eukprot:SAG25_NODE_840_length_5120_cov_3.796455_5_plen_192_part_00